MKIWPRTPCLWWNFYKQQRSRSRRVSLGEQNTAVFKNDYALMVNIDKILKLNTFCVNRFSLVHLFSFMSFLHTSFLVIWKITSYEQETSENISNSEQPSVWIKILNVWPSEILLFKVEHCRFVDVKYSTSIKFRRKSGREH